MVIVPAPRQMITKLKMLDDTVPGLIFFAMYLPGEPA